MAFPGFSTGVLWVFKLSLQGSTQQAAGSRVPASAGGLKCSTDGPSGESKANPVPSPGGEALVF